jgi:hypothetical protein
MNFNIQVRILKLLIVYENMTETEVEDFVVLSFAKLEYKDEDLFDDNM